MDVAGNASAQIAFQMAKTAAINEWGSKRGPGVVQVIAALNKATEMATSSYIKYKGQEVKRYALGGLNTSTGLAWLDGTTARPERILSGYQTELFEDMIQTLHAIRTIGVSRPGMSIRERQGGYLPNVEKIEVHVGQLNEATDYKDAAERLVNEFYREVARSRAVGGIQGW